MKIEKRSRGRPRAYDPDTALEQAMLAFWRSGYAGTSLDMLSDATGLNRPSLYSGFGDKLELYLKAMQQFQKRAAEHFAAALKPRPSDESFWDRIARYLDAAIELYASPEESEPKGCALLSTATAQALTVPEVGSLLARALEEMDAQLQLCLKTAVETGELPADTEVESLAFLLTSTVHSIGIRARAGDSRQQLKERIKGTAPLLFPS